MRISIRKKIILAFLLFLIAGGGLWFLNYYRYHIFNEKLQIIEKKDDILNAILEARRYEKNYFLYLEPKDLENALSYVSRAHRILSHVIEDYSLYIIAKNMEERLKWLREYEGALSYLVEFHHRGGFLQANNPLIEEFPQRQKAIRELGSKITTDMEKMVGLERRYVNRLARESRIYHFVALGGILVLSVLTAIFWVFNVNRPLKSIEGAIHKIAEGDYTRIPPLSTGDEFESLVSSLNNMINELNRRNEQLIQSRKLASIGTFTSGIAHELNNPLNNISLTADSLLEECEALSDAEAKEMILDIINQTSRAGEVVKNLLDFSRSDRPAFTELTVKEVIDKTIKLVQNQLMVVGIKLNKSISNNLPSIKGDLHNLQQVFVNLFLNAIQAMPDGGTISIDATEDADGYIRIDLSDTGQGIAADEIEKVFDPFYTTKSVGRGTGLGLSIVYGIVKKHGGYCEVKSEVKVGTTFSIYLPTSQALEGEHETPHAGHR